MVKVCRRFAATSPCSRGNHPQLDRLRSQHRAESEQLVDQLTQRIKDDGYQVLDGPRRTGEGYYESVVVDPDGNRVEITA